jgi:hypothetical protein
LKRSKGATSRSRAKTFQGDASCAKSLGFGVCRRSFRYFATLPLEDTADAEARGRVSALEERDSRQERRSKRSSRSSRSSGGGS